MPGGKLMDMFMDKLAQKLTAQEIIKANTAAETEELSRLRNQIDEYDKCLAKLQQLLEGDPDRMQGVSGSGGNEEFDRYVKENMEKLNSCLQTSAAQSEQLQQLLAERLESVESHLTERFEEADRKLGERLGNVNRIMGERLESVDKALDERLEDMDAALDRRLENMNASLEQRFVGLDRSLEEKLSQLDSRQGESEEEQRDKFLPITETVHKECVKVYRNVQAVILEESGKQAEALGNVSTGVQHVGKKLNKVFGVSLIALLLSLLSAAIQILNMLNIQLF